MKATDMQAAVGLASWINWRIYKGQEEKTLTD